MWEETRWFLRMEGEENFLGQEGLGHGKGLMEVFLEEVEIGRGYLIGRRMDREDKRGGFLLILISGSESEESVSLLSVGFLGLSPPLSSSRSSSDVTVAVTFKLAF